MRNLSLALLASLSVLTGCSGPSLQSKVVQDVDLRAYTSCAFADGLEIVEEDPLAPGVTARTVDTIAGPKQISMLAGIRVMFAYPNTDFFANVKAEKLPALGYPEIKQSLIGNFNYVLNSSPTDKQNHSMSPALKALDGRGLDRNKLEGGVIGMYLFFDDARHIATTVYLLNQDPSRRKFQTLDEYRTLRDRFLSTYTSCIASNLRAAQ